jgi:hypothetical protein
LSSPLSSSNVIASKEATASVMDLLEPLEQDGPSCSVGRDGRPEIRRYCYKFREFRLRGRVDELLRRMPAGSPEGTAVGWRLVSFLLDGHMGRWPVVWLSPSHYLPGGC